MRRRVAATALLALSLTACGSRADFTALGTSVDGQPVPRSTLPGGSTTGSTLPGTTGTTGGPTTGTTGALPTTSGDGATGGLSSGTTGATTGPLSGSTNKAPVRLAYVIQGSAGVSALTGSSVGEADSDVAVRNMNALVAYANAHGGVGGRKISAQGFKSEATSQQPERLALCKQITEDYKAQVVLDQNQYLSEDGWACFAQHKANYFGTVTATDRAFLRKHAPYVNTTWLSMDRLATSAVDGGTAAGFYKDGKVGVIMMDQPVAHTVWETKLKPGLLSKGVKDPQVRFISTETSSVAAQTNAAELAFASSGVNRVVFFAHIIVYLGFTNQAESQGYHPRYLFTDYQGMTGVAAYYGSPSQNRDSIGISSTLTGVYDDASRSSQDVTAPYDRKAMTPGQQRCLDILSKQTGRNYYDPQESGDTLASWSWYCDGFFAWWEAARFVGASWTPARLGPGLSSLGKGYLSTIQHSTDWSGGVSDAASSYRAGRYNETCRCYVKITGWLPI